MVDNIEDALNDMIKKHDRDGSDKLGGDNMDDDLDSSMDIDDFEYKLKGKLNKQDNSFDSSGDEMDRPPKAMQKKKSVTFVEQPNIPAMVPIYYEAPETQPEPKKTQNMSETTRTTY